MNFVSFMVPDLSETRKEQLSIRQKEALTKQGYRLVGDHSAVKVCEWTKKSLRGHGNCYKYTFYGIRSHQCLQMTTSMYCASRCKFCWRGEKAPVGTKWYGPVNEPKMILDESVKAHLKLMTGFGSHKDATEEKKKEAKEIRHVALSLTGEPITYPLLPEILKEFHDEKISTFLVTNAQFPEAIEKINHVTQLYLSIDAPTKEKLKKIDRPLFKDFWEKMNQSLDLLKTRKYRTCIRLTMIKGENVEELDKYAELIKRGEPDFIELKSYMWVGGSQENYKVENMPYMEDMKVYTDELLKHLPEYEYLSQHPKSRAVLLAKKSLKGKRWIDFNKFFELAQKDSQDYTAEDYSQTEIQPNC